MYKTIIFALMMEAARTSETLVNFYQTTQRYNPEDSHLKYHKDLGSPRILYVKISFIFKTPLPARKEPST
jgi:hypothetical protein